MTDTTRRYSLLTTDGNVYAGLENLPLQHSIWTQYFFHTEGGVPWDGIAVGHTIAVTTVVTSHKPLQFLIRREPDYVPSHEKTPQGV